MHFMKRVFLIVLDSVGIGAMPDAHNYQDEGSNTIFSASTSDEFYMPNMKRLGFFGIDGMKIQTQVIRNGEILNKNTWIFSRERPDATVARMQEASNGKDTTTGHWEIAGIISKQPFPTFPSGFPKELIKEFELQTNRKVLCNKPYSGTEVIKDYGKEHMETGALIVYTSADSVFQIAAHEEIVPIEQLYQYCEIARKLCQGKYGVGRVIARPFEGEFPNWKRTARRHDYSLKPTRNTILDILKENSKDVIAIGKIYDIFAGQGITKTIRTTNNKEGIEATIACTKQNFEGICFTNLVDFDMLYGHRNDIEGYARALSYFDQRLPELLEGLKKDDIMIITADHGCDPGTKSTDHSREYTPLIVYGNQIKKGYNLGTRKSFSDIGATILDYFDLSDYKEIDGRSFLQNIKLN